MNYENLQVAVAYESLVDAGTSVAISVAALAFGFVLLMVLSFVGRRRGPSQNLMLAAAEPTLPIAGRL